ncbi:unnamed protein product [Parascedosporium putredinis]|uniref:Uncharacterized protein n=1 Tax=Parascedosporium putredinis TaxID=1442378 RepID=A0A9P1MB36_9PEZI|nr:unnamed protein product [Parascedosporium putredinis]CAI7998789.1 unnamed protein product [Parascedosporium putredinis]
MPGDPGKKRETVLFSPGGKEVQLRTEFYFIRNRVVRSNYVLEKAERDVEFVKADIAALNRYYEESDALAKR